MLSNDEAIEKFKDIIGTKAGWEYLKDSQFIDHLSIFVSWALRAAQYGSERALQEQFLSTALNQSSILAHAEDRGYVPRKATPSAGVVGIENKGVNGVSIPAGQMFRSGYGLDYRVEIPDTVYPGEIIYSDVRQISQTIILQEVAEEKPFYEVIFDAELTSTLSQIDVSVDTGDGYQEWQLCRLLQNADSDSTVYDEFFSHNGQFGIRFGNGEFGKVPPLGSSIQCVLWLTEGATSLLPGMVLTPIDAMLDITGAAAEISFIISSAVKAGAGIESGELLRRNLCYWPLYQEQLVWKEDYIFFLRHKFPGILWINVWGETEAETESGYKSLANVNKIFISGYAQDYEELGTDAISELSSVRLLNRRFVWVAPVVVYFSVTVTGVVSAKYQTATVRAQIISALDLNYGLNSPSRKHDVLLKDLYAIVDDTGSFSDGDYTITLAGNHEIAAENELVAIDMSASTVSLVRE